MYIDIYCIYLYIYISIYLYIYISIYLYINISIYLYLYIYIYQYIYISMYLYIYINISIYLYLYIYIYINISIYIYVSISISIYICVTASIYMIIHVCIIICLHWSDLLTVDTAREAAPVWTKWPIQSWLYLSKSWHRSTAPPPPKKRGISGNRWGLYRFIMRYNKKKSELTSHVATWGVESTVTHWAQLMGRSSHGFQLQVSSPQSGSIIRKSSQYGHWDIPPL